jgi:hypothetical protein
LGWGLLISGVTLGLIAIFNFKALRGRDQARGLVGMILVGSFVAIVAFVLLRGVAGGLGDWILESAQNGR